MSLEALFDAVIVKPIEYEESTYGNIIVPDLGKEKNETAEVVSVGPGKPTITGEFIPTILTVGDKVVLPTMGFTKLPYEGEEFYVGPENQILAKINSNISVEDVIAETEVSEEEIKNLTELSNG
jgi:chaperonin GroES